MHFKNGRKDEMADFSTQTVIVTGAGQGIGKGVAALFGEKGANVVVAEIDEHLGKKTVEEIQLHGGEAFFVRADVRKEKDIITVMERAFEKYGRIDILINNAGKALFKSPYEVSIEEWDDVIHTNLRSVF